MPVYNYPTIATPNKYISKSSGYTLTPSDDTVEFSAAATATLPTAVGYAGKRYTIRRAAGGGDVTIATTSSQTVELRGTAEASSSAQLKLYVDGDHLTVESNGTNWVVVEDGLQPHVCEVSRDAAQPIDSGITTKIEFDTIGFDIGGIADVTTNDRVDVKRTGKYLLQGQYGEGVDDTEAIQVNIRVNGSNYALSKVYASTAGAVTPYINAGVIANLAVNDYVELFVNHEKGTQQNTNTQEFEKPKLCVTEIR